jgi:hypothetical protein
MCIRFYVNNYCNEKNELPLLVDEQDERNTDTVIGVVARRDEKRRTVVEKLGRCNNWRGGRVESGRPEGPP